MAIPVLGLSGESHAAPADTLISYWAALGTGAQGIVASLQMTRDEIVVCCPSEEISDGDCLVNVSKITAKELHKIDAGASFRSTVLGTDNQPTGEKGKDTPWAGIGLKKAALYYPQIDEVLRLFGRRTDLMLLINEKQKGSYTRSIAERALNRLTEFGLAQRVTLIVDQEICAHIRALFPTTPLALLADPDKLFQDNLALAEGIGAEFLSIDIENVPKDVSGIRDVKLLLTSKKMIFAPKPNTFAAIAHRNDVAGLLMRSVDRTVALTTPLALILSDDFSDTEINQELWACGYSHSNQDTTVRQENGFVIDMKEGGSYSGGSTVTLLPIHDRFDSQVDFFVEHPQQGTTFEIAAIGIDPGYFHINNKDLDSRTVNLTFDVHGAPPYASCERDEDDGFRIGWNNGYNLTKVDKNWKAASVNMYNKYGRDVGNGEADNPAGTLRLIRNDAVFAAFYKDKYNQEWVCSGAALVPNLGPDVHIRLGAKHWGKGGRNPPWNRVVFSRFRLFQF